MPTLPVIQKQYRALAAKIALIVVLVVCQILVWGQVQAAARHLNQKRSQGKQIVELRTRLTAAEQALQSQQELRTQLDTIIPPESTLPQVIDRLERMAGQQQVTLAIADIREKTSEETVAEQIPALPYVVTLQARGGVVELLRYLEMIEHTPELTVIEQWSLAPQDTAASTATIPVAPYSLNVQVTFFLQADDDAD